MADGTAIEWTHRPGTKGETWNPTTGCDRISAGCDNCYALTLAKRLKAMGSAKYQNDGDPRTSGPGFGLTVHPDTLDQPLRWRQPRTVFVDSMSDLFHARVPVEFVRQVWDVMARTQRHTYQILTKRPGRMARIVNRMPNHHWPLRNVWLGTSIESDEHVGRADDLRRTESAVRFISAEPLLGPLTSLDLAGIDWVIVGGESGPGARPMHPDWARGIRDQCIAASVPCFFKQWGEWCHSDQMPEDTWSRLDSAINLGQQPHPEPHRVGKKAAGRELDGREWSEYPRLAGAVSRDA